MVPASLKNRSDIHLARKIWHVLGVLFIFFIYIRVPRIMALQLITVLTLVGILNDLLRKHIPALNRVLLFIFHSIMREHEKHSIAGTSYLFIGTFINILLFPKHIVALSLLFLAIGDPLASFVGIKYGKDKIVGNKSLQGSLAAFVVCTLIAGTYFYSNNLMTDRLIVVSLLAGISGALAELIPLAGLDDNFTLPVFSAILLFGIFYLFGGF